MSLVLALLATTWISHGPHAGKATALAVAPSNARVMYAANPAGVLRSDDGGGGWRAVGGRLEKVAILAVDPADPNTLFAADAAAVHKSNDGGETWNEVDLPDGIRPIALLVDPENRNTIYTGAKCAGVFKSTDGGATWAEVSGALCVAELSLDPAQPSHLFTTTELGAAFESLDAGRTWTGSETSLPSLRVVAHPTDFRIRYGITNRGGGDPTFLMSSDAGTSSFAGGLTWTEIQPQGIGPVQKYLSLDIDRTSGRLFLGTDQGMFRSGDGGRIWFLVFSVPATAINGIAVDPVNRFVVAGTSFGLFATGFPYVSASALAGNDHAPNVGAVIVDPGDPDRLFAASDEDGDGQVFLSSDGAVSWTALPGPADARTLLAADAVGSLFAAHPTGTEFYRLLRQGFSVRLMDKRFDGILAIAADPHRTGVVYVLSASGIDRSGDSGENWLSVSPPGNSALNIVADPVTADVLYVVESNGITRIGGPPLVSGTLPPLRGPFAIAPSNPQVFYAVSNAGSQDILGRSTDGGRNWTWPVAAPSSGDRIEAVAVDPRNAMRVWIGTRKAGVLISHDGGATWSDANGNLPSRTVHAIAISGSSVHLGTDRGVWSLSVGRKRRAVRR